MNAVAPVVVVPLDLLRILIEAADSGIDGQDSDAHALRRDGERSGAAACLKRGRAWFRAANAARAILESV